MQGTRRALSGIVAGARRNALRTSTALATCLVLSLGNSPSARALGRDIYDLSLDELSRLVITDTKTGQAQETVTQKIELYYPRDFEQQAIPHGNIAELLTRTSGQFVNPLSRVDANWGSFGGLGPKYNGYLLDGLPIDSFADALNLDPWIFGHVEIHKGPASVMYSNYLTMDFAGNETPLAGITNFVLRDWIDTPATRIQAGYGSYNTFAGRVYHQDRKGNFNYFLGASVEHSAYTDYGAAGSWLHILDDPEYLKLKVFAKVTYLFNRDDHKVSLFANYAQQTGDAGRPNRDFAHRYVLLNASYSNQVTGALNLQVKAGFRNYDRRWGEDDYPADLGPREHDGVLQRIVPADVTLNFARAGNGITTVGVDSQYATYESHAETLGIRRTGSDVSAWSLGAFLQDKLVIDSWVFRLGGRYNHTGHLYDRFAGVTPSRRSNAWDSTLWSAGIRYNPRHWVAAYANAGSSFVAPSAKQLGGSLDAASAGVPGANGQLPNLGLRPESGIGLDVGIDLRPIDAIRIGVRGFYNQLREAIVENVVSTTPSQTRSMNVGNARSVGCEVDFEHRVSDRVRWFANFTYTWTRIDNPEDPDQDGVTLPFVPEYMVNAGVTARLPLRIEVSPYLHVVANYSDSTSRSGRRRFGARVLLNLRTQMTVYSNDSFALHAVVDLNNLLHRRYAMPWQFQDPGFNASGSLELTF